MLTTGRRHSWRIWLSVAGAGVLLGLVSAFVLYRIASLAIGGNRPSGVACEDLPSTEDVEAALRSQRQLVQTIEAISANVTVEAVSNCERKYRDRAEIAVLVSSGAERDRVVAVLDEEPFAVPVSIVNV